MFRSSFSPKHRCATTAIVILVVAKLLTPTAAVAQSANPQEVTELQLERTIEKGLSGGQKEAFAVKAPAGSYVRILIQQKGIDVFVRVLDKDGTPVVDFDADPRLQGEEVVEFVTNLDDRTTITIESRQRAAKQGTVSVTLQQIGPATNSERALDESRRLNTEGIRLWRAAKYPEALERAEKVLAIRLKEQGPDHPDTGMAYFALANIYSDIPDVKKSETFYLRALEIRDKALGRDHISLAGIYNNLGVLYKDQGKYTDAERLYQRALEIREKALEPGHLLIASSLNNLAGVVRLRGDETRAAALYRRVLEIREKAFGPDHPDVATALNNLVSADADLAAAEPIYLRALAIREKSLPADHPDIAQTLYNMAIMYSTAGKLDKADAACRRAFEIFEKSLGPEHPFTTYPLNHLGVIAKNRGDFIAAEDLYLRTVAVKEKVQGPYHPDLGGAFANLANLYTITGQYEKAIAAQQRANEIFDYNIALNLSAGSEREKLNYIRTLTYIGDQTLTLALDDVKNSNAADELAFAAVLQRKGRVLDAFSDSIASLRRRAGQEQQKLLDERNAVISELSSLVLNGPGQNSSENYKDRLRTLEAKRDVLETRISRENPGYFESSRKVSPAMVRGAMTPGTALVEFVSYRPVSRRQFEFSGAEHARPDAFGRSKYAVFVMTADGKLNKQLVGDQQEIDSMIEKFRQSLRDPRRTDNRTIGRILDDKIMRAVRRLAGDATHLLISADGSLNLIPFESLVDENDRYLVERFSFSYLTSGRDLARRHEPRSPKSSPLVVANPEYGDFPRTDVDKLRAVAGTVRSKEKRRSITSARNVDDTYFLPLSGTLQEAQSIKALFPHSVSLTGVRATETALKLARAPEILHFATHGFFLEDFGPDSTKTRSAADPSGRERSANPLLRAGLALAGANMRSGKTDDGILTALEASGLDLAGTKLVVLSACDTGVGEIRTGEGVYGLRRAFVLAGAESLLMSLWPVSDLVTRELMAGYYANLKQGFGRGESIRRVQLEMLKRPNRRHPFYWAGFIQYGEWASLDKGP